MRLVPLLLSCFTIAHTYKILCVFPTPSRSHNMLAKGIVQPLLKAGHEVTWVTPYDDNKPQKNLKFVYLRDVLKIMDSIDMSDNDKKQSISYMLEIGRNVSSATMGNKELRDILVMQQFDAVVTEWFMSDADAGYAAVQKVPWIVLFTHMSTHVENLVDDVRSVSTVPSLMTEYSIPMNFWQRLVNTASFMIFTGLTMYNAAMDASRYEFFFSPLAQARGVDLPPFRVASSNISIVLVNSHPSIAPAQSLPPNVIDIGGYHIDEGTPTPKELQELMDTSVQGVVYFSMGSIIKSSTIPEETISRLIQILGSLKMTVLWKLDHIPKGLPKNVHIRTWWPQSNILAHPNIRLFITHGGALSTFEAIHYGVPLLAVPVFGDQPVNARRAEQAGYARVVPFEPTFAPKLEIALTEMLRNDSYYHRAKYLSKLFNNRPVSPSKLITHYIELAIESKGAYHLRSATYLYKWYERWMLDQVAFVVVVLYVLKKVIQKVCRVLCGKKKEMQLTEFLYQRSNKKKKMV
ncbi:UDP-glucuronosyltransferase 1-7C-like [Hyposmocoma kahamanoa]|uniref:UDP-glucuronosyltransferase 1-7C-like n=1 Tax=Hyposmocoma kahamanoa TaxID=1477025 RepID=UPI000E6D6DDD|nr:UDP-glucuronosyltransferase 1-7C-like [Hyposmocoma kahamanoa]